MDWLDRTVKWPTLASLTLDQWLEEFNRLKKLNEGCCHLRQERSEREMLLHRHLVTVLAKTLILVRNRPYREELNSSFSVYRLISQEVVMLKTFGISALLLGSLGALGPQMASARDHDYDRDHRAWEHERHERRERREHERWEHRYRYGYYDRYGYWHSY